MVSAACITFEELYKALKYKLLLLIHFVRNDALRTPVLCTDIVNAI